MVCGHNEIIGPTEQIFILTYLPCLGIRLHVRQDVGRYPATIMVAKLGVIPTDHKITWTNIWRYTMTIMLSQEMPTGIQL